jgi:hypothetical protein
MALMPIIILREGSMCANEPFTCQAASMVSTCQSNNSRDCSEMQECLRLQIVEIEKYKWCLGEAMRRDPLEVYTMNDICMEWIRNHAADFRKWWQSRDCGNFQLN